SRLCSPRSRLTAFSASGTTDLRQFGLLQWNDTDLDDTGWSEHFCTKPHSATAQRLFECDAIGAELDLSLNTVRTHQLRLIVTDDVEADLIGLLVKTNTDRVVAPPLPAN